MLRNEPVYLKTLKSGLLAQRVQEADEMLAKCTICAWGCGVDRCAGKRGICKTGERARVRSYSPHLGEEDPIRGWRGSGTIFFSGCNLRCQFCQNYDISQAATGGEVETQELATMMLELQSLGCHNINLVSPSHVVPQILAAVWVAAQAGLRLPLVYNTGGYDSIEALRLLDGIVDIYMPDMKYASSQIARYYSKIPNYAPVNQAAVREMYRQVGDLQLDEHGVAQRGLLVRHLVLPNNLAGTGEVVRFLAEISRDTYLNLMDQYHPAYNARQFPKLNRRISAQEYQTALDLAHSAGLQRLDSAFDELMHPRRAIHLAIFALLTGCLAYLAIDIGLAWAYVHTLTHPGCNRTPAMIPGVPVPQEVWLPVVEGLSLHAWYYPGRNGMAIIALGGMQGALGENLPPVGFLVDNGFGVLQIDSRACARPVSPVTLGADEALDGAAGMAFLKNRPEVGSIGIFGFSMGAAAALHIAAENDAITAVVAEGGYFNLGGDFVEPDRRMSLVHRVFLYTIAGAYWLETGANPWKVSPIDDLPQIGPRPLLLIYGESEADSGRALAQYSAARAPKDLWIVTGGGHGSNYMASPAAYKSRIVQFFSQALQP